MIKSEKPVLDILITITILFFVIPLVIELSQLIIAPSYRFKATNPITEEELIEYVKTDIRNNDGDEVEVKITKKSKLRACSFYLDTCLKTKKVKNGYSYKLKITNINNPEITATAYYEDEYYDYTHKSTNASLYENRYKETKATYYVNKGFKEEVEKIFDKYYIYTDITNDSSYDIFITTDDYNKVKTLIYNLNSIKDTYIINNKYTNYGLFIYKDKNSFNNTNFELLKDGKVNYGGTVVYGGDALEIMNPGKTAQRIGSSREKYEELFKTNGECNAEADDEYEDYRTFDHLVFWYYGSSMQLFGIK